MLPRIILPAAVNATSTAFRSLNNTAAAAATNQTRNLRILPDAADQAKIEGAQKPIAPPKANPMPQLQLQARLLGIVKDDYFPGIDKAATVEEKRALVRRLFAPDAVYKRITMIGGKPQERVLNGIDEIEDFYCGGVRDLKGDHVGNKYAAAKSTDKPGAPDGLAVAVEGRFVGTADETEIKLGFKDFWVAAKENPTLITYRESTITPESTGAGQRQF